jgi:putative PEP-CTERM system TPR-repeat lipoprotein
MTRHPISLAIALAFTTSASLYGCDSTANLTEQEHIQRAKDFETKGDLNTSVIELKNALQKNPNSAQARLLLGQVYLKSEQGVEAEKELLRAKSLGVGDDAIKPLLAESLLEQGEYQRLLSEISLTGSESAAHKAKILRMFGDAKLGLHRLEEACLLYADSVNFDASHVPAHWGLMKCAFAKGRLEEARSHMQAALKIEPNNADSWVLLGDLELAEKNTDAAEAAYTAALKYDPTNVVGHFRHASLMLSNGRIDAAQKDLNSIRKVAPTHPTGDYLQAQLYFEAGQTEQAIEATLKNLKARPDNVPAYLLLGILQYNKKSYGQAAKTLSTYLQVVPGNLDARKILAATYLRLGEPEQTLALLKPLLAAKSDDPQLLAIAAEAYMVLKEPDTATSLFEKASDLVPTNAALQTQLAVSRMATGDTAEAIADLERASRSDSGQHQSGFILALHYLRENQPDKALEALNELEKVIPNDPTLHNMKGAAYGSKKDLANARSSFEKALAIAPNYFSAARNLAQLDLAQNRPADARRRYEAILAAESKNIRAMIALAELAANAGRTEEYLSWLNKAVKADPQAVQPKHLLARYYVEQNQGDKALALAREAIGTNPDDPAALSLLGKTQLSIGQNENALVSFTKLVQQSPDSVDAHYHLGLAQRNLNRTDAARASLQRVLELQPAYLPAQEVLIKLEAASGRTDAALSIAASIQSQRPKSPLGYDLEGQILTQQKRYAEATKAFEQALSRGAKSSSMIELHKTLLLAGNAAAADRRLADWVKSHPKDEVAKLYAAEHNMRNRRYAAAIAHYEALLALTPNSVLVLNNLANAYLHTKDTRALATAEKAYSLAKNSPAVMDTLGWILVQSGDIKRGLELLSSARAAAPKSAGIRYHHAVALAKSGDRQRARKELEQLLKDNKDFLEVDEAKQFLKGL